MTGWWSVLSPGEYFHHGCQLTNVVRAVGYSVPKLGPCDMIHFPPPNLSALYTQTLKKHPASTPNSHDPRRQKPMLLCLQFLMTCSTYATNNASLWRAWSISRFAAAPYAFGLLSGCSSIQETWRLSLTTRVSAYHVDVDPALPGAATDCFSSFLPHNSSTMLHNRDLCAVEQR